MDIPELMVPIVIVLIVIAITLLLPKDALSQVGEKVKGPFLIVPTGLGVPNNIAYASPTYAAGRLTGYDVTIETKLAYINPEAIDDGDLEVIPIISFKGGRAQGSIRTQIKDDAGNWIEKDSFTLNKERMTKNEEEHDWRFTFHVTTGEPPIQKYDSGDGRFKSYDTVDGLVKEEDVFILRSPEDGTFLVKLDEYLLKADKQDVGKDVTNPVPYKCDAVFMIRCMNETPALHVQEAKDCVGTKCSDNLPICNGVVDVEINGIPDCEKRENEMRISVKRGIERGFGEEISISFWRKSDCIYRETDYLSLVANCESKRLSGLYAYEMPLIE